MFIPLKLPGGIPLNQAGGSGNFRAWPSRPGFLGLGSIQETDVMWGSSVFDPQIRKLHLSGWDHLVPIQTTN